MPRPSRRLLLLPLLLLVPLGVLKWRADHPPLNTMDKSFRAQMGSPTIISLRGGSIWEMKTGIDEYHQITIRDPALIHELVETLRFQEHQSAPYTGDAGFQYYISLLIDSPLHSQAVYGFDFERETKERGFLIDSPAHKDYALEPRFAPRLQSLLDSIVMRAKAPGQHSEVVITTNYNS